MDKFLMWALIILIAIIILFSTFSISIDNSSPNNKKLGLINNSISNSNSNNSNNDNNLLGNLYNRRPNITNAGLGTPQGAKFYAPKCG